MPMTALGVATRPLARSGSPACGAAGLQPISHRAVTRSGAPAHFALVGTSDGDNLAMEIALAALARMSATLSAMAGLGDKAGAGIGLNCSNECAPLAAEAGVKARHAELHGIRQVQRFQ